MRKTNSKKTGWVKKLLTLVIVIAFFVAIILTYYRLLVNEKRNAIIRDGEMSARQVETRFNEYLATSVDAIELTAYTLEGMIAENRTGEEILDYLLVQSTAVINTIFENTMGVYGYINGGYYDGAGWIPDDDFVPKERPWYIAAAAKGGEITLIDPYVDAQSGTVMMSLAKLLNDGDSVVSMDIYLDRLQEITEDAVASDMTDIELILDSRSMVIAHSDRGEIGKEYDKEQGTLAAALMEHMSASEHDSFELDYNGSHYIAYQARLKNDWLCLSVKDATDVFKPLERLLLGTVGITALVVFVLTAFISRYNKRNQTIEILTEETQLDKLTGFLNKGGTAARLPELCRTETGMLAILDLDNFKLVNDLYGHDMGDRVLTTFADVVRRNTRMGDVLCRIGGDEFLIFCVNMTDAKVVSGMTKRLNQQLTEECRRLMGEDFGIPIGVSVGAVPVPEQGRDYQTLFQLADKALYQVKQNGKHSYAVYDAATHAAGTDDETPDGELARITQILEERGGADAALWLGQDAFSPVYRFVLRSLRQSGGNASKLLFLLSTANEDSETILPDAAERFAVVLGDALDARDVVLQSKPTQFLVLLPRQSAAEAEAAAGRVAEAWGKTEHHERVIVAHVTEELHFEGADL